MDKRLKYILFTFSVLICLLIIISSYPSLVNNDFYKKETLNWQIQSIGQDIINLFCIVPFLFITSILILKNHPYAILLWQGCLLYLVYTYTIYCFDVHFNHYFITYCAILGLCFYQFIYFLVSTRKHIHFKATTTRFNRIIGIYFLVISILFYALWLKDILPSILNHSVPPSLIEVGLFSNPVHVLDLSIFLPGIFIIGILIFRKHTLGYLMAPIMLTFFILMDITIAILTILMNKKGVTENIDVAYIMFIFMVLSCLLLMRNLKLFNYSYENNQNNDNTAFANYFN